MRSWIHLVKLVVSRTARSFQYIAVQEHGNNFPSLKDRHSVVPFPLTTFPSTDIQTDTPSPETFQQTSGSRPWTVTSRPSEDSDRSVASSRPPLVIDGSKPISIAPFGRPTLCPAVAQLQLMAVSNAMPFVLRHYPRRPRDRLEALPVDPADHVPDSRLVFVAGMWGHLLASCMWTNLTPGNLQLRLRLHGTPHRDRLLLWTRLCLSPHRRPLPAGWRCPSR